MSQGQAEKMQGWKFEAAWLSGIKFDSIFIFGVLAIALLSGLLVWNDPNLFGPVLFIDLWFLGYHHVISTYTKLGGTPEDRQENHFLIYKLPFLVIGAVGVLAYALGIWSIITIYFFWQWYHYTRQSYGISIYYGRKAQQPTEDNPLLFQAALWSIPVWGILMRCHQGWDTFLFQPVWLPAIPIDIVNLAAILSIALVGYWAITRLIAFREGRLPLGQTLFMLSHFTAFYVGYILIPDINIGWLVANIWHNAQYILFVWLFNTKRFEKAEDSSGMVAWASKVKPVRIMAYFVGCILLTSAIYTPLMYSLKWVAAGNQELMILFYIIVFQTLNFHHYIVDSIIWKARKKQHQKVMKLNG